MFNRRKKRGKKPKVKIVRKLSCTEIILKAELPALVDDNLSTLAENPDLVVSSARISDEDTALAELEAVGENIAQFAPKNDP